METQETTTPTPPSLGNRILNVFASPSEAFDGISGLPSKTSLWLAPFLIGIVMAVLFSVLLAGNDALRGQITDIQAKELQKAVDDGRITQQQADSQLEAMSQAGPVVFAVFGAVGYVVMMAVGFFGGSLVLWLAGKYALKSAEGYSTYLAAYGVSYWIGILGALITMLLMNAMGSLYASPGAGLLVLSEFDRGNMTHRILARLDVFAVWQTSVIGIGLSKITNKSIGMGLGTAFVLWILWVAVTVLLNIGG